MDSEYRFRIAGGLTPATIPMGRLAEYMTVLARLLGEQANVHLQEVEEGSVAIVAKIDASAQPRVGARAEALRSGDAPKDTQRAFDDLDDMLRFDDAVGTLSGDQTGVIVPFPGKSRPEPLEYGPIHQDGYVDGQVIRVGGRDETVPINLEDGPVVYTGLYTTRDIAQRLGGYLYRTIRVRGTGTWFRGGNGTWDLRSFKILDFEELDETPLLDVVESLRKVEGNGWGAVPDPIRALLAERHDDGDAH